MRKRTLPLIAVVLITAIQPIHAAWVFLKNGKIYEGTTTGTTLNTLTFRLKKGGMIRIPRQQVMRILYTRLYMGKVYVRMRDGRDIELYQVDEDRETYTFRKKLYNPKEITIKRSDVLFIAQKNPSGLRARADREEVFLKWHPPYNEVQYYKVYMKKPETEQYRLMTKSSSKSCTIKDLKSNTAYMFKVTAVDTDNYESLSSNIVTVKTLNFPPDRPSRIVCNRTKKPGGRVDLAITWLPSKDKDGHVAKYLIYEKKSGKYKQIGVTPKPGYNIFGKNAKEDYRFGIKAVDNLGASSSLSTIGTPDYLFRINLTGMLLIPLGNFADLHGLSYGGMLTMSMINVFFMGFEPGIETGYFYFPGEHNDIVRSYMVPMLARMAYSIHLFGGFKLTGFISLGYTYASSTYYDVFGYEQTGTAYEPMTSAGISIVYNITRNLFAHIEARYIMIIEDGAQQSILSTGAGFGARF